MPGPSAADQRLLGLLAEPPATPRTAAGYLDLLGDSPAGPSTGITQRLMGVGAVAAVYEHWWRPALGRVAKGAGGPSMDEEVALAMELLCPNQGDTVLDVACGTGRFTRAFAWHVGPEGLSVGLDGSRPMLDRAVAADGPDTAVYLRGDAVTLPLRESSVDAVCCFAALHMFADPHAALDSFAATLRPGGRIALLTTARRSWEPARTVDTLGGIASGQRMFERGEIAAELRARGFTELDQTYAGVTQIVGATLR
ncbi:methyltransferase type 11 [Amycolatopsis antarctica]|uniref:Methyltransferase type 11 n=1 Tax=Amycolatopsis antarctica TaxID=1854586 RepID=A0A263D8N3_9PSEU|nr:methyltransferase domain-containing protein [Amycolatopsis antarctica]OZM73907.1 methyltransferase type 11 [Amycolatopsis antarctica]